MFVGEILASWVREDCLDGDGQPDPIKMSPIAYAPTKGGGLYCTLGAPAVKAFRVGKPLMDEK
jgi:hypothetical protein